MPDDEQNAIPWFPIVGGARPADSPDAWCWLRQGWGLGYWETGKARRTERPVSNFKRWLIQRDVKPDGRTQLDEHIDLAGIRIGSLARKYEHIARRTDKTSGNNSIYFKIDPEWYGNYAGVVRLYVTYKDAQDSAWRVEYSAPSGSLCESPTVTTTGSEEIKTVAFEAPSLGAANGFAGGMDFRIRRTGGADAVIQLLRLVKWNGP